MPKSQIHLVLDREDAGIVLDVLRRFSIGAQMDWDLGVREEVLGSLNAFRRSARAALQAEEGQGREEWRVVQRRDGRDVVRYDQRHGTDLVGCEDLAGHMRKFGLAAVRIQSRTTYTLPGGTFITDWVDLEEGS